MSSCHRLCKNAAHELLCAIGVGKMAEVTTSATDAIYCEVSVTRTVLPTVADHFGMHETTPTHRHPRRCVQQQHSKHKTHTDVRAESYSYYVHACVRSCSVLHALRAQLFVILTNSAANSTRLSGLCGRCAAAAATSILI